MGHSTYLLIDLCSLIVPLLCSFDKRLKFFSKWKQWLPAILLPMVIFIPWDIYFTEQRVWGFSPEYLIGVNALGIPIEEWLFFICIPYACLFTFAALATLERSTPKPLVGRLSLALFAIGLALVGFFGLPRWYTASAFLMAAFVLFLWISNKSAPYRKTFFFGLLIILIPFTIVNGILTGLEFFHYPILSEMTSVTEEVVWYSADHHLGWRLFSIPIEDMAYALSLLGLNFLIYSLLGQRQPSLNRVMV